MANVAIFDTSYDGGDAIFDTSYESSGISLIWNLDSACLDPNNFSVTDEETATPNIFIKPRLSTIASDSTNVWVHWGGGITGMNGKRPLFELDGARRWVSGGSTYHSSWRPWYSYDRETWVQFPAPTLLTSPTRARFQLATAFNEDTVYICDHIAYRQEHFEALAADLVADNSGLVSISAAANSSGVIGITPAENDELSRAIGQQNIYGFVLGNPASATQDGGPKRWMVVDCGLHSGEVIDGHHLQGIVDFYLNGVGSLANTLRANWLIGLYFCVTANGRYGGHYRGTFRHTKDPNRDWGGENGFELAETIIVRDAILADLNSESPSVTLDLHSAAGTSVTEHFFRSSGEITDSWVAALNTVDGQTWDAVTGGAGTGTTIGSYYTSLGAQVRITAEPGTRITDTVARYEQCGQRFLEATATIDQAGAFYEASGATKGITLTLHTGATPVGAMSNVQAAFFDQPEPKDFNAPTFKTGTASINSSGVITLNVNATTALNIDQNGFVIAYKLDAGNHQDSLAFAGRATVVDIS